MNVLDDERLPAHFWSKVSPEPNSGCWLWTGCLSCGYGSFAKRRAHRHAYISLVGAIPEGLELDHLCRVRCCVNPAHLEPVTKLENMLRGMSPHAIHARATHCPSGHEYSPGNTYRIPSSGGRVCRTCKREANRRNQVGRVRRSA